MAENDFVKVAELGELSTGKMKYVDSAGRVEKFQKKYNWENRKQEIRKKQEEKKNETLKKVPAESSEG